MCAFIWLVSAIGVVCFCFCFGVGYFIIIFFDLLLLFEKEYKLGRKGEAGLGRP